MDEPIDLQKQLRVVHKRLQRSEADRAELELSKEKNDALLRKVIEDLHQTQAEIKAKSEQLEEALTQLQATQDEMIQTAKMAALGELVAGVAHEVNTPIGTGVTAASHLEGATQDILKKIAAGELTKSSLDDYLQVAGTSSTMILRNLNRAADLIHSFKLVAVDRSFSGNRTFNVSGYLNDVLASLGARLKKTKLKIEVEGPDNVAVDSDPGLFSQILTNLVMNSIFHAYDENEEGQLLISFRREDDRLHLTYSDDGRGIPEQHLKRVFDAFFTTRRGSGGSGLGLSIIHNIVTQKLGGTIRCESTPAEGTRFCLTLPNASEGAPARF